MLRAFVVLILLAAVAGGLYLAREWLPSPGGDTEVAGEPASSERPATAVAVAPVAESVVVDELRAVGTVSARNAVALTVRAAGSVSAILFDHGDTVEAGTPLVRLEDAEERAQLAAARAELETARRAHERAVELRRDGAVSQQALDQAAAELEAARAQVAVAEARLDERVVRAPFAGRLGLREISPGAWVEPGSAITTLDDITTVYVDFRVPERHLPVLAVEQPVTVTSVAHQGQAFAGRVVNIGSRIDPATRQVRVRALLDTRDGVLRAGQLVTVEVAVRERPALLVPSTAVYAVGRQYFAFIVDEDNRARRRVVTLGERQDGRVEIVDGLALGERLVVEGATKLDEDDRIRVVPPVALDSTPASES